MDFRRVPHVAIACSEQGIANYRSAMDLVEQLFDLLEFDKDHLGTEEWNPLAVLIREGDTVLLKPNLIRESHLFRDEWEQIVTHPAVIKAVLHYVFKALNGTGVILVADGPQTDSNFAEIYRRLDFDGLKKECKKRYGQHIEVFDFREEEWRTVNGVIRERIKLAGDPQGYTDIDLGQSSEFVGDSGSREYYGAEPNFKYTQAIHADSRHGYRVGTSALKADVVINLPKLKTHKKAGVTLSLKNLVGIHGDRNYLPHHTMGTPMNGGDEFPLSDGVHKLQARLIKALYSWLGWRGRGGILGQMLKSVGYRLFGSTEDVVRSGNWYGNDTTWRMALDLNKILFYATTHGDMASEPQRQYLTLVDGIIAGEGKGPMAADPKPCGVMIGGYNPVAVDCVSTRLMGFDIGKIPILSGAFEIRDYPLADFSVEDIQVISKDPRFNKPLLEISPGDTFHFEPHFGWKGHIELEPEPTTV